MRAIGVPQWVPSMDVLIWRLAAMAVTCEVSDQCRAALRQIADVLTCSVPSDDSHESANRFNEALGAPMAMAAFIVMARCAQLRFLVPFAEEKADGRQLERLMSALLFIINKQINNQWDDAVDVSRAEAIARGT
jgi:hypothetical protein